MIDGYKLCTASKLSSFLLKILKIYSALTFGCLQPTAAHNPTAEQGSLQKLGELNFCTLQVLFDRSVGFHT